MTIREIDPAQEPAETKHRPNAASRHRPNATTNSVLPPLKPTATAPHSDHNNITPLPLRAKRKSLSISNQGHNNNGDEGRIPAPDRDQEASMQDSTAQSWEYRRMMTKQLRLTAVDSGRRRRTSTCNQSLPSYSSSSPSSSPNCATPQSTTSNSTEHSTISPPSTYTPGSNGSLVDEMDLDAHLSSPSTVSADVDVASLSDTLDVSILEEDLLVRQFRDLSSPPPPLLQDYQQPPLSDSFDDNDNQTPTYQLLLEDARAGKRVDRKEQQLFTKPTPSVLPTELLIKVFEWLAGYQSDLCSAALVSIEWNLCATGQLYRYPEFANTIHWAMFIQTLCKNKEDELERPTSRRYRPPIITPTCLSTPVSDHPPILFAPERMANFGARTQQPRKRDRLDRTLGEYVRGIDLSRRAIGASRLCSCGRPYGPPVAMKECSVCSRPGKGSHSKPVVGSTIRGASGKTSTTQDDYDDGSEIDDGDMGVLNNLTVRPSLAAMREGFQLGSQQTPNVRLGQSGQSGFDIAGFDPASNDTSSMLEWSELRLSSTTDFGCLIRPIATTRTNSAAAAATSSTATTSPTAAATAAAAAASSSSTTTAGPSLIALARSRQLAANRFRGEQRLASQDAASTSTANIASPSEGGGSGNRGKVVVEKDASSTRKPMMITVSSLIQMARHCPNLEWLCLASTALADDTLYLETGDYMSTLQPGPRTGLTNVQVTVMEGIGALGQSCLNLRRVWLVGCDWVTHREVLALTTSCRRLQMMDVRHCARLEGRLSRLYAIMEGQDNNDDESLEQAEETGAGNDVIRNERVATPLNFETAPTTVLLGASVSGRRVRDGAMDDLFYWVYITSVVSSSGTSSTAAATALPTPSTATSMTPPTYNPQAVNEILSLLSSVALAREAPTDPVAFREWFKAIQDYDLVSYQPLRRLKSRYPMGCRPGEQKINGGGIGGASSSSSSTNSSGYNTTGVFFVANSSSRRNRREQRQQQGRSDSDSDSEYDSDSSSGSGTISQRQQHHGAFGSSTDSDSHDDDSEDNVPEENLTELDD
ncbi:hypothetical protein KI688_006291 [Linnemannia hyalina]|uniref:F-box domain-containing protein n=1 Tax=Linnemannia hyalina TaxID=64524 RepID=A0A9P8BWX6_9FUNG|nr:hypothetical protein KI688_006291 [Linnemannia hyalina]